MGRILNGKKTGKMAILGLSFKGNVDDMRESPAVAVVTTLKQQFPGFTLAVFDPHIKSDIYPSQDAKQTFSQADLAILLTPHNEYQALDPKEMGSFMKEKIVLDTHHHLKAESWLVNGFKVFMLGTGSVEASPRA